MIAEEQINNAMKRSKVEDEEHVVAKVGKSDSSVQIIDEGYAPIAGYNYRILHNTRGAIDKHKG